MNPQVRKSACGWLVLLALAAGAVGGGTRAAANCPCMGDVDNDGLVRPSDQNCVQNCAQFGQCLCCINSCDVDCDGNVTMQDVNTVQCLFTNPPNVCCPKAPPVPCCLADGACQHLPPSQCGADGGTVVSHCPLDNRCVPPADDCFTTQCGRTLFDFCNDPIPADFFAPSSEPFTGIIILGGDGAPDTTVRRFNAMLLDGPPETIPIELVQLSLTSCSPITVTIGTQDTVWDVSVDLSQSLTPVPPGSMTVTKQHPNGGVFTSQFNVLPRFTFTEVNPPTGDQVILDFGFPPERPPTLFETTGSPKWVHNPTVSIPFLCGVNFVPGVEQDTATLEQCCTETCHANPGGGHEHCTKTCNVCPKGACCNPSNNSCSIAGSAATCAGLGGIFKGNGTNCADSDSDGLADWFENNACCQPSSACNISSSPNDSDSDNDGLSDGAEVSLGCNPCDSADCVSVPCCLPSASCQFMLDAQCSASGGTQVSHCPLDGRCVPPDDDCWTTECGRTLFDFCNDPIPADFFAPSSEPFTGVIILGGDGLPDTTVRRFDAMLLDGPPETIPIELVQLSLSSCSPITITINSVDTLWDVSVDLSSDPVPPGSMTVTKQHPNGGVFTTQFNVLPRFTFTEINPPSGTQKILDFGLPPERPPTLFETTDTPKWVHQSSLQPAPCGVYFVPGVEEDPQTLEQCCTETCHANPGGGHDHCTKQCNVCPTGACCSSGTCTVVQGAGNCGLTAEYKGDGTNCDDSDGDGIPDWFENNDCCQSGDLCNASTNPNNPDTDGDGINDGTELSLGCDPCTANDCIPPGDDCFATSCGDTAFDFCETPIPADFFDPASNPFDGVVVLQGATFPAPDTFMERLSAVAPDIGESETIPIQLTSLNLVSCSPITVTSITDPDTLWDVSVTLSPTPAPQGSMTVRKTHPNGGVFSSEFFVQPVFIFTEVGNPANVRVLDTGAEGQPPDFLESVGTSPWVYDSQGEVQPHCGQNFVPGAQLFPGPSNTAGPPPLLCCVPIGHAGPGHLHVTGTSCQPCPSGACCLPDASCVVLQGADPAGQCNALGGTYGGDGTTCDDSDADGIPDWFEKSDCCVPRTPCFSASDPHDADTDDDGVNDGAEVAAGTDPCVAQSTAGQPVWNSDPLSPERTTRSLRFRVQAAATATGTPPQVAIKVTPIDLQHPIPPNLPQFPPPDFSAYESATCTAMGEMNSCARWVGKPGTFLESQDNPGGPSYRGARLQCEPFYFDWIAETASGPIAVVGAEIAPSSEFSVQSYGASCKGLEAGCLNVSSPVPMRTRRYGDVEAPFNPPSGSTQPSAIDVTQLVNKFKNAIGALPKATAQLQPNLPELNADVNALDIVSVVDAVKQFAYPFSGPCPCPSTVTCDLTPCATPGVCVTTYGTGSLCIKTCTGGPNIGDPCINNSHCPGGTCSNGFCRDRCGRCAP